MLPLRLASILLIYTPYINCMQTPPSIQTVAQASAAYGISLLSRNSKFNKNEGYTTHCITTLYATDKETKEKYSVTITPTNIEKHEALPENLSLIARFIQNEIAHGNKPLIPRPKEHCV